MEKFSWTEIGIIVTALGGLITLLLSIISYFVRKWMKGREDYEEKRDRKEEINEAKRDKKDSDIRAELVTTTTSIATSLAEKHDKSVQEIKEKIQGNRDFYMQTYQEIKANYQDVKNSIDALSIHVATTNGSIIELKGKTAAIEVNCKEKTAVGVCKPKVKKKGK